MARTTLILLLILILVGCSDEQPERKQVNTTSQTEPFLAAHAQQTQEATQLNLLFFLDPNGAPCQMQDAILISMQDELAGKVNVQYVKTTVPSQRNSFYANGIRALPTILLVDGTGQEIRRLTPGVQKAAAIRALIQSSRS